MESKRCWTSFQANNTIYHNLVSQIVWTTNAEAFVVDDLVSWRAYTGQSVESIKGWGWIEAIHPGDREQVLQVWSHAVKTKELYEALQRVRGADGNYRYFLVRGVPVLNEDGSIREWVGTCTDIHEQQVALREGQIAEEALLQSNQKVKNILESITDAFFSCIPCSVKGDRHLAMYHR